MENNTYDLVQSIVKDYKSAYLRSKLKGNDLPFSDFISQESYWSERKQLQEAAGGRSLEGIVFDNLTNDQVNRIGGLFHSWSNGKSAVNIEVKPADVIDNSVLHSSELQTYLDVRDFLGESERLRFAEKLSAMLYGQLSPENHVLLNTSTITKYMLNIGFIKTERPSHALVIEVVKNYPSLFKGEDDALNSILERYVDDELSHTPVSETESRIRELKVELNDLYGGINGS